MVNSYTAKHAARWVYFAGKKAIRAIRQPPNTLIFGRCSGRIFSGSKKGNGVLIVSETEVRLIQPTRLQPLRVVRTFDIKRDLKQLRMQRYAKSVCMLTIVTLKGQIYLIPMFECDFFGSLSNNGSLGHNRRRGVPRYAVLYERPEPIKCPCCRTVNNVHTITVRPDSVHRQSMNCVICLAEPSNVTFTECKHECVCIPCLREYLSSEEIATSKFDPQPVANEDIDFGEAFM